jgi:hypothetical protein
MPELALNSPLGGLAALWACERFMGRRIHFTQPHCLLVNIARAAIVDYRSGAMVDASASWGSLVGLAPNRVALSGRADQRGNAMKVRLILALVVAVAGTCLIAGPAAAAPPTEEEFSPVGDQFLCGETVVTVQSGTVLEREHVRELGSGRSQVIVIETPIDDVILTDEGETPIVWSARRVGTS